jgi:hypothetical protein
MWCGRDWGVPMVPPEPTPSGATPADGMCSVSSPAVLQENSAANRDRVLLVSAPAP